MLLREALVAYVTFMGFVTRMGLFMKFEITFSRKTFAAGVAFERFFV